MSQLVVGAADGLLDRSWYGRSHNVLKTTDGDPSQRQVARSQTLIAESCNSIIKQQHQLAWSECKRAGWT